MNNAFSYFNDGANAQAQGVLAYLGYVSGGIEASYDSEHGDFRADVSVDRFHNCREQGYVVSVRSRDYSRQLNIIFFEHRNSDEIVIIEFELNTINPVTIDMVPDTHPWHGNKHGYDKSFSCGKVYEAASYISERLEIFWKDSSPMQVREPAADDGEFPIAED